MSGLLIIASTEGEAAPFRDCGLRTLVSGVGKVNAAVSATCAMERTAFDAVVSVGVAGSLPHSELKPGDIVIADHVVYAEEGMVAPDGFHTIESMGFPLADFFNGNRLAMNTELLRHVRSLLPNGHVGAIATVATCSGTSAGAEEVYARTDSIAEAMEGAAVVHAAGLLGVPGIEVRAISNHTGDRDSQDWDMPAAQSALHQIAQALSELDASYRTS